jgi:hypothetical protein
MLQELPTIWGMYLRICLMPCSHVAILSCLRMSSWLSESFLLGAQKLSLPRNATLLPPPIQTRIPVLVKIETLFRLVTNLVSLGQTKPGVVPVSPFTVLFTLIQSRYLQVWNL